MTMNLTIFTVFASLLIILSRARKPGEELRCTALRSVQKSDFIAVIITNPTPHPHPHLAATLLLLCAPSRDKISVVVKILPAANIRRRDETQGDSVFSTGARRVSGRELVGVTSNKWKLSRTGFSSPSSVFPTTIVPWKCRAAEQAAKSASALLALSGFVGTCRARHLADCLVLNNMLSKKTVPFNKPPNQYQRS